MLTPKKAIEHMKQDYNVHINGKMITRALKTTREEVMGNEREQYGKVRDYLNEIIRSNSGSTALVALIPQPETPPLFDKLYISLDACKHGFKKTYEIIIKPVNSETYWQETSLAYYKPQAPLIKRSPGHPVLRRKVDKVSKSQLVENNGTKVKRSFQVTCSKYGEKGHYYKNMQRSSKEFQLATKEKKSKNY
ncbi:hypothetical protein Ahy_B08g092479 [Arachis hypogaea]|uniref:Uncharacterized protein n=1 Tax=Arachis hypogaea TaxID=3818 RepID=A0A444Y402_ARAHY|nr:hypothetical protein Ahy_B08g092479 [Arachis hypogaea]